LESNGFSDDTRIIYTSDHGESMGNRGLWGKFTMYEESAAVPFLMAGPDVPAGQVSNDPITLVDCYQTILEAVGVEPDDTGADLPGASLWPIARGECLNRVAFSEYHAVASQNAYYMLREGQYKYVHFVNADAQLFDLEADPKELLNLADDPEHAAVVDRLKAKLREILDPEAVDQQAKADQAALIERHGGRQAVLERGTFTNSPAPGETPTFQSTNTDTDSAST
jgi:choline-sulfatase